jgi:transcriptional regulator with XRE-family HTH domain
MHGSLATKLRVLRAERGLTVRQVAELSGVAKETISQVERGERHPYDRTLAKLAHAYDVPVNELLEEPALAGKKAEAPDTGQPQTSTRLTAVESEQALARVLEPARAEVLRDQQAANRFFASEGIERDYSGPLAEAEAWERFLDEFSPEERPGAFSAVLLGYARLEHARANLEANFTRSQKMLREGREQTAQLEEKIGQLEEKIAKMEKRLRERNEQVHAPSRAEAERQGVRD